MISLFFSTILLYLHLCAIKLSFLPIGTRSILSALCLFVFLADRRSIILSIRLLKPFIWLFLWVMLSLVSIFLNPSDYSPDLFALWEFISQVNAFLASAFIAYLFFFVFRYSYKKVLILSVWVVIIFATTGLLSALFPNLSDFYLSIQDAKDIYWLEHSRRVSGYRFIGFGPSFFGGGVLISIGLLIVSWLLTQEKSSKVVVGYVVAFVYLSLTGPFFARTTLVGTLIGLIYIIFTYLQNIKKHKLSRIIYFFILVGVPSFFTANYLIRIDSPYTSFAFEVYHNYDATEKLEVSSVNELLNNADMKIDFNTLFLGDGFFSDPSGYGFYRNTDVGYLRLILYTGLFSAIAFVLFNLAWLTHPFLLSVFGPLFVYTVSVFFLILNFKGLASFNELFFVIAVMRFYQSVYNEVGYKVLRSPI